ncbi:MAG: LuxR C-terminal-related transcriptional regulator [Anaerolineae bacterium]
MRAMVLTRNVLLWEGLRSVLRGNGIEAAERAGSPAEAEERLRAEAPALLFVDAGSLAGEGALSLGALRALAPEGGVVLLSLSGPRAVAEALAHGASAYLCDEISAEGLDLAVRATQHGCVLLDRGALGELLPGEGAPAGLRAVEMTPREREVLGLMAEGLSNRQIAGRLSLRPSTVKVHAGHILKKLQVNDRAQAAAWAARHGVGTGTEITTEPQRTQSGRRG